MAYGDIGANDLTNGNVFYGAQGQEVKSYAADATRPYDVDVYKETWEDTLQLLSTSNDIFEQGMSDTIGVYGNEGVSLPDSIGMRISSGGDKTKHTFMVLDPLPGLPGAGNESLLGNEKGQNQRQFNAFYNEVKDGISVLQYGVDYNYKNAFGMFERATGQLAKYWSETKGRMKRECLVEVYNRELSDNNPALSGTYDAGTNGTQGLNPNWIINGVDPVAANADLTDDAVTADGLPVIAGADDFETATSNLCRAITTNDFAGSYLAFLDTISFMAEDTLMLEPLADGERKYILSIPYPVWYKYTALNTDNTFGAFFTKVADYPEGTDTYAGEMGSYRNLRIVPDNRWPGFEVSQAPTVASGVYDDEGQYTTTYVLPGNEDDRDKSVYDSDTSNFVGQLGLLMGKSSYIERMEKDLHFKYEIQDYESKKGIGTFMEVGYNLMLIRKDGQPVENRNSAVVFFNGIRV